MFKDFKLLNFGVVFFGCFNMDSIGLKLLVSQCLVLWMLEL